MGEKIKKTWVDISRKMMDPSSKNDCRLGRENKSSGITYITAYICTVSTSMDICKYIYVVHVRS
jgi:hypothetical protein